MSKDTLHDAPNVNDASTIDLDQPPEAVRRDFLKRFGGYAAATPLVTFTLMSSYSSKATASGGDEAGG